MNRPAHRPSRKNAVVDAAMHLLAAGGDEHVTVARIAAEAGMTASAVYYHYGSREEIILEGLTAFAEALTAEVKTFLRPPGTRSASDLPRHILSWAEQERDPATTWFCHSNGLSMAVETLRRKSNEKMINALAKAIRADRKALPLPHAVVVAAALVAALEVSAETWFRPGPGAGLAFETALDELCQRIVDAPLP